MTTAPTAALPAGFVVGAATSSYQIEGGVREDGRGESIWDRFSDTPGATRNGATGDVAADHFHRVREDVGLIADLGLTAYRFSIAWPRVLPDGVGRPNGAGLDFYDRLLDELTARGIASFVTLYHWDLPQALEDAGGWPNRATAEAFGEFARVVAGRLGDRAAALTTLNEPWCAANLGYRTGTHAPGRTDPAAANAAAHHLLVAHGLGVRAIRDAAPGVPVGITLNFEPKHPASGHPLDLEAAIVEHDHFNRWFLDPIVGLPYPEDGGRAWGWDGDEIRSGDRELIAEPIDLLGVNYYRRQIVRSPLLPANPPPTDVERTSMGWEVYPGGLAETLEFVQSRTGELPLYVMENGAAFDDGPDPARDPARVEYLRRHLEVALGAVDRGVPLRGYFAWSLLDNFEWAEGYGPRFGIVHVDYATQARRIRDSGRFLGSVASSRSLPVQDDAS